MAPSPTVGTPCPSIADEHEALRAVLFPTKYYDFNNPTCNHSPTNGKSWSTVQGGPGGLGLLHIGNMQERCGNNASACARAVPGEIVIRRLNDYRVGSFLSWFLSHYSGTTVEKPSSRFIPEPLARNTLVSALGSPSLHVPPWVSFGGIAIHELAHVRDGAAELQAFRAEARLYEEMRLIRHVPNEDLLRMIILGYPRVGDQVKAALEAFDGDVDRARSWLPGGSDYLNSAQWGADNGLIGPERKDLFHKWLKGISGNPTTQSAVLSAGMAFFYERPHKYGSSITSEQISKLCQASGFSTEACNHDDE